MTIVLAVGGLATLQLETVVDPAPAALPPRIRVTVTDVASSLTFSLTRLCEGETWPVPGWSARTFTDSDTDVDFVPPLNRPITYTLSANGSAICTATIVVDYDGGVLQDPLQPDKWLHVASGYPAAGQIALLQGALKEASYGNPASRISIMGAKYGVAIGGQPEAATNIPLHLVAVDNATTDKLIDMRSEAPILVYRPKNKQPIVPAVAYMVAQFREQPITRHIPGGERTNWSVSADLVSAVIQAAISGFVTNDQVQQLLAGVTNDEVQAAYAGLTNLDVQKNPLIYADL